MNTVKDFEVSWVCPVLHDKRFSPIRASSPEEAAEIAWAQIGTKPSIVREVSNVAQE